MAGRQRGWPPWTACQEEEAGGLPVLKGLHLSLLAAPTREGAGLSVRRIDALLEAVDELPVDRISVGDHQGHHVECYTALGYIAARTRRVGIGPTVTTAATRDPGLHAASLATLDALSGGRAFAVLGRGDGVVRNLGVRQHSIEETRDAVVAIRALLRDGRCTIDGRNVQLPWPQHVADRVPLGIAGAGPRMLAAAGQAADEVYVASSVVPEAVSESMAVVADAAQAVGRDTPVMWWVTPFGLAERRADAVAMVRESLSTIANHSLRGTDLAQRHVPAELQDAVRTFHRQYDYGRKNTDESGPTNGDTMIRLGLEEYFLERFAVAGTPDEVVARIRDLEARGVDRLFLKVNDVQQLRLLSEHVLPRLGA